MLYARYPPKINDITKVDAKVGGSIRNASRALTASATRTAPINHSTRTRGGDSGNPFNEAPVSAIVAERNLAIVLAQKIQEPLVIPWFHVEETRHNPVIAACFLESA